MSKILDESTLDAAARKIIDDARAIGYTVTLKENRENDGHAFIRLAQAQNVKFDHDWHQGLPFLGLFSYRDVVHNSDCKYNKDEKIPCTCDTTISCGSQCYFDYHSECDYECDNRYEDPNEEVQKPENERTLHFCLPRFIHIDEVPNMVLMVDPPEGKMRLGDWEVRQSFHPSRWCGKESKRISVKLVKPK